MRAGSVPGDVTEVGDAGATLVGLVPADVTVVEAFGDDAIAGAGVALFPEEELVVARAVDKRRREFTAVRLCARRALARLGVPPAPLLPDRRGAPRWPAGVVGSMTHCAGYRAAAVAGAGVVRTLGIDAEPNLALPDGLLDVVARPDERPPAGMPGLHGDRLLFSVKESVYKAWYPLTGQPLGFHDVTVRFDPLDRTFTALLPGAGLQGRWTSARGLLLTAVVIR